MLALFLSSVFSVFLAAACLHALWKRITGQFNFDILCAYEQFKHGSVIKAIGANPKPIV
jgi:hypothetical protein